MTDNEFDLLRAQSDKNKINGLFIAGIIGSIGFISLACYMFTQIDIATGASIVMLIWGLVILITTTSIFLSYKIKNKK